MLAEEHNAVCKSASS